MSDEKATMSIVEAGALLGIGRNASYAAAHRGEIPTIKIGGKYRVPVMAIQRLLASAKSTAEAA
jgi:excisionase family DNA binding protein